MPIRVFVTMNTTLKIVATISLLAHAAAAIVSSVSAPTVRTSIAQGSADYLSWLSQNVAPVNP